MMIHMMEFHMMEFRMMSHRMMSHRMMNRRMMNHRMMNQRILNLMSPMHRSYPSYHYRMNQQNHKRLVFDCMFL